MPTPSGFSNQKMRGPSRHQTLQTMGSDRVGIPTAQMYLYEKTAVAIGVISVEKAPKTGRQELTELIIGFDGPHLASKFDVLRMMDGVLAGWEFEIIQIVDATTIRVYNIGDLDGSEQFPEVGDSVKSLSWTTALSDSSGALQVSQGPVQFTKDGATTQVTQDTAFPFNNIPLPTGLYIIKDGVTCPVTKDTGTPANTVSIPVELSGVSGPINITAGDLNVQLTDLGANFDATRIGDGSGNYLGINASTEALVHDQDVLDELTTLNTVDFATEAKQDTGNSSLSSIDGKLTTLNAKDFSTSAKQDTGNSSLSSIDGKLTTLNAKDFSTSAKQDAEAVLIGAVTETAPASDTASSGLNGRLQRIAQRLTSLIALLPTSLGQKASASSLAVTLSSEQEAEIGIVTETAPASDTASSGLNGRLQRIAQRLTSIIALLPASLGQKTGANSLAVVMASDYTPPAPSVPAALTLKQATVTAGLAAIRCTHDGAAPSATRRKLRVFVDPDTATGKFYLGTSAVASAAGATRGEQIFPGAPFVTENDANDYYIISDTASQPVSILEVE